MVSKYRECFDQGLDVEFESQQTDAHAVAGLVKLFLREMPEPLLSYDLYDAWVASNSKLIGFVLDSSVFLFI